MAVCLPSSAMESSGRSYHDVHPFFRQDIVPAQDQETREPSTRQYSSQLRTPIDGYPSIAASEGKEEKKARKVSQSLGGSKKRQKTLNEIVNPQATQIAGSNEKKAEKVDILPHLESMIPDKSRQKQRWTIQHLAIEVGNESSEATDKERQRQHSPRVVIPLASSDLPPSIPNTVNATILQITKVTPPKKMLRLSENGKFSSPPTKSVKDDKEPGHKAGVKAQKKGRKQKVLKPTQLLVLLKYCSDPSRMADLGDRVASIMAGTARVSVDEPRKRTLRARKGKHMNESDTRKRNLGGPKDTVLPQEDDGTINQSTATGRTPRKPRSTHPFFMGKPHTDATPPSKSTNTVSPRKSSAITPGKLKTQAALDRPYQPKEPPYNVGFALLKDRQMVKHPGAVEAPWPNREQTHVRSLPPSQAAVNQLPRVTPGKGKRRTALLSVLPTEDSILQLYSFPHLPPEGDGTLRDDGYHEPHASLSLPRRLLLSGLEVRDRVSCELSNNPSQSVPAPPSSWQAAPHPALRNLLDKIPDAMSCYDQCKSDTLCWAQKYAPSSSSELFQPHREMDVLKQWLVRLTVSAVESIGIADSKLNSIPGPKTKKKRKRAPSDLDDFLVDDEEVIHDTDQLSELDDSFGQFNANEPKSVVQVTGDGIKHSNVVLLSGPHGCGKTAAAYAVAKELGFRVFEISSSERRTGKDVLDKVGDMTENHLVRHHGTATANEALGEEPSDMNAAFERDLASGRQGKMNAFFQPQTKSRKPSSRKQTVKTKAVQTLQKAIKQASKAQQQSLILLEEVDVLYKEDKEFWTVVLKLIATSKRPFILTCNDEDIVPIQSLALHAILRFTPPSLGLAVDYLLLVAATEGHLLKRSDVSFLYASKHHDLRACFMELDLWCQMGVGDPKSGLSWMYPRWPPGSDTDVLGRKLRVVSDGTYHREIGFPSNIGLDDHETLLQFSQAAQLEPHEALGWYDLTGVDWLDESIGPASPKQRYKALKRFAQFTDSLSDMDIYSRTSRGSRDVVLDVTQPEITQKVSNSYTEGMPLLQTDEAIDHYNLRYQLAVATTIATYGSANLPATTVTRTVLGPQILSRNAFAVFDPIAVPDNASHSPGMQQSIFDGSLIPIVLDVAPYVRNIVRHDLERECLFGGNASGGVTKKSRTTRAARSAMDEFGIGRQDVRREKWFCKTLNLPGVIATGGEDWSTRVHRPQGCSIAGDSIDPSQSRDRTPDSECA